MGLRALPGKSAQINYQHSLVRVRSMVHVAWDPCGPVRPRTRTRSQAFVFSKTWLTHLRFFFCIISLGCLAPRVSGVVYEIWIAGIAQKLLCVTHKIGLGLTRGSLVPRALLEVELTGGCYLVLRGFLHEWRKSVNNNVKCKCGSHHVTSPESSLRFLPTKIKYKSTKNDTIPRKPWHFTAEGRCISRKRSHSNCSV